MRILKVIALAAGAALFAAPAAGAHVLHTVTAGETLWSIAASNNLTTRTVAIYNGLSSDAHVILGSALKVPTTAEGAAALASSGVAPRTGVGAVVVPAAPAGAPRAQGAYVVRAGDTLSALAAQTGVSVTQMAYVNGLDPNGVLLTGTVLKLPNGAPAPARAAQPAPAVRVVPSASPLPTAARVSADRVKQLAAEHGAPASLAAAIAWQESGFNNAVVSTANARGVMQVMPGTWDWVQRNLASSPLSPTSAEDNVRVGSLYLARLMRDAGGDPRLAAAGYYQGLSSVRRRGMFDDTQRYVDNVMALRARFGG
ncbi:MAG TPA: LysM peptidoglycan-binding domain-containing protein [Solirubrobacteraceae bacterium]|jgi:LysM repeat protein|nr:LysM peptidoglycan-binding domain-containing protein [Solirubrobacteraceae bacterium]